MNKKATWGSIFGALAGIAGVFVATHSRHTGGGGGGPVDPPSVPRYTLTVHVCEDDCVRDLKLPGAALSLDPGGLKASADAAGNWSFPDLPAGEYAVCAELSGYVKNCADAHKLPADGFEVSLELARDVPPVLPLHVDGHIFRTADGQAFRWRGVSSFQLLDRFAHGEDISDVLTAYKGFNVVRVWPYVPKADWGASAWDSPAPDVVVAFLQRIARSGFHAEITLLTDDDTGRIAPARQLLATLKAARPPNAIIEIGNEPTTHKNINTAALKADTLASGFLVSSGNYEDTRLFYGSWLGFHSGRDGEWPRRAHDAIDYWNGGGPDFPEEPAVRVPSVCDEPIRPDQAGYNAQDFRAYFGACAAMSGGATYHTETGKHGQPPTADEARIAAVVLEALNAFPADTANGGYRRIDEGGKSLRTYVISERAMIRVRPTTKDAPEAGWTPIDADGVLWKR